MKSKVRILIILSPAGMQCSIVDPAGSNQRGVAKILGSVPLEEKKWFPHSNTGIVALELIICFSTMESKQLPTNSSSSNQPHQHQATLSVRHTQAESPIDRQADWQKNNQPATQTATSQRNRQQRQKLKLCLWIGGCYQQQSWIPLHKGPRDRKKDSYKRRKHQE